MTLQRRDLLRASVGLSAVAALGIGAEPDAAAALTTPDRILRNGQHFPNGFTVPAGKVWAFETGSNVRVTTAGNVVVRGTLRMGYTAHRHTLRFIDVDESAFVGGGMEPLATDVGLWVVGAGVLDVEGRPRAGWNRVGRHATWRSTDLLLQAPIRRGDYDTYTRHSLGDHVPRVRDPWGNVQRTEVFNLTRTVTIEGTPGRRTHVLIRSSVPQRIRYARFNHMGPRKATSGNYRSAVVLGRYPVHFHHCGNGSRGSLVEGCVVTNSSHAFVQHESHGVTMRDCVAYRITDDAFWWDEDSPSADVVWDHCAVFDVRADPGFRGSVAGFLLGRGGGRKIVRNCVAVGARGFDSASGFQWPEFANDDRDNVWIARNLVAHNNSSAGVFVWQNDSNAHVVDNLVAYHNGTGGVRHGAYVNEYKYKAGRLWGNGQGDILLFALARSNRQTWTGVRCDHLVIAEHALPSAAPEAVVFADFRCRRVTVNETGQAGGVIRIRCAPGFNLTRSDFTVLARRSAITVYRTDGRTFRVR